LPKIRRERGEGCVYPNSVHGKFRYWEGYVVIGTKLNPVTGKPMPDRLYRRSSLPGRRGELECEQKLREALAEHKEQLAATAEASDPTNYTLWDAILDWHRWTPTQPRTSQGTADKLLGQVRKWVKPALGDTSIFDLDTEMLMKFFEEIAEDMGASSLKDIRSTLERTLDRALATKSTTHYAGPNPVPGPRTLPEAGHKPKDKDFLTGEQAEDAIAAAAGTRMYALVMMGFMLGLRPGEMRSLKWGRDGVDIQKGYVYILKAATSAGDDGKTKTVTSRRALKIPPRLLEALRWHHEAFVPQEYVFTREDGRKLDRDALGWRFSVVMRNAGIEGIEDPYVMRHSFASICYHNNMPVKKISEKMGHANEGVTLRVYIHLFSPDVIDTDDLADIWDRKPKAA
jgi:integrase